jgi:predicted acetyltransferase
VSTEFALRRATEKDLPAVAEADGRGFGVHYSDAELDDLRTWIDMDTFLLAVDPVDDAVLGATGSYDFAMTMPGGSSLPIAGVTWVSVALTHRRRGILRALLAEQHREFVGRGLAVSALTASEGSIYGRFGYGTTTLHRAAEIDRRRAVLRPDLPDSGGVRQASTEQVRTIAPDIHRRWAATAPGALSRDEGWWDYVLSDREWNRNGATALFHLVHADGYASYRRVHADRACELVELFAATPEAHRELWRTLLAVDLVETVRTRSLPLDDPLPLLLTDPRQVRTTGLNDGMWLRVLDVPAALSARPYRIELDVVLDVDDPFLDRGGRFRLRGGPEGATCEPTSAPADLRIAVRALGPLLLGGQPAAPLATAGLIESAQPAVLERIDTAFGTDRLPRHGSEF